MKVIVDTVVDILLRETCHARYSPNFKSLAILKHYQPQLSYCTTFFLDYSSRNIGHIYESLYYSSTLGYFLNNIKAIQRLYISRGKFKPNLELLR